MLDIRIDDKSKNSYCAVIFNEDNELIWGYSLILVNNRISLMIHTRSIQFSSHLRILTFTATVRKFIFQRNVMEAKIQITQSIIF